MFQITWFLSQEDIVLNRATELLLIDSQSALT